MIDVVLERAERDIAQFLPRPLVDRPPDVGLLEGAECQTAAALPDVEAEFAIEILRDGEVRHGEMEMIDRMNAKFAGAPARLDVTVDRCHGALPRIVAWAAPKTQDMFAKSRDSIHHKIFLSMENNFSLLLVAVSAHDHGDEQAGQDRSRSDAG